MFVKKAIFCFVFFCVFFLSSTLSVNAQPSVGNKIGLRIPRVYLTDEKLFDPVLENGTNKYLYNGRPLKNNDQIRYAWFGTFLDAGNAANPTPASAYLKIYKDDDSQEENFITNYGSSPLPVNVLSAKLKPGLNTLLFVLVENAQGTSNPPTKVQFQFNYSPDVLPVKTTILSPVAGSVFAGNVVRELRVKTENFFLEKVNSNSANKGILEVYLNSVVPENSIVVKQSGKDTVNGTEVTVTNEDLAKLVDKPDQKDAKLIFVTKKSSGEEIPSGRAELPIQLNYGGSLDLGLPRVRFVNPEPNSVVTNSTAFQLEVSNFRILPRVDTSTNDQNSGYLQIRVNDELVKGNWTENTFTLTGLGKIDASGVTTIRADLVNSQFVQLEPRATATLTVVKKDDAKGGGNATVTNTTWRYIIIIGAVLLILGSIAVLVIKG